MGRQRWVWDAQWLAAACVVAVLAACGGKGSPRQYEVRASEKVVFAVSSASTASSAKLETTAQIMQRRLRALGVRDAVVSVEGQKLVATGSGIATPAAHVLQRGLLEFRPVLALVPPNQPVEAHDGAVLSGRSGTPATVRYLVGAPALTGAVTNTKAQLLGGTQGWVVDLALSDTGTAAFNQLAATSYPRQPPQNSVAIVLDGVVQTAPAFQTNRFSGDVQISGSFTETEAHDLATVLRFGALPLQLEIVGATP